MLLHEVSNAFINEEFFGLLYEGRLDFIQHQFGDKILAKLRNEHNVPANMSHLTHSNDPAKEFVNMVAEKDPSRKKIYVQWMINMYLQGKARLDDFHKIGGYLKQFDNPQIRKTLDKKDIGQYKSVQEMEAAVSHHIEKQQAGANAKHNTKYLIDKPHFKVVIPLDHESSCAWGEGTSWCTAAEDDKDTFDDHHSQGPLYVIITNVAGKERKFQLHPETDQFMNRKDMEVSAKEIDHLSEMPEFKEFLHMLIDKHYGKYVGGEVK